MAEYNETNSGDYDVTGAEADAYGPIETDDGDNDWYGEFLKQIGVDRNTIMENWNSPSNQEILELIKGGSATSLEKLKALLQNLKSGQASKSDYGNIASILAGLYSANKSSGPTILNPGYQGGIPKYTATRQMLTAPPAGRRPGSGGINYGGDVTYTRTGQNLSAENAGISTPVSQPLGGTPTLTQPSGYDLPSLLALIQQLQGAGLGGPGRPSAPSPTSDTPTSGTPAPSTTVVDRPPALTQATTPLAPVAGGQSELNLYEPGYDKPFGSTDEPRLNLQEIPQVTFPAPPDRIIEDDFDMRRRLQEIRKTAPTAPVPEPHLATAPKDWFADHDDFVDLSRMLQEIRKTAPTAPVPVAPTPPGTGGPGASQQPMHTAQPQGRPLLAAPQQKFEMFPPGESDYRIEAAKGGLLPNGFVVPADVVSHLGNGSSEAGLKVLARQFGARPIRGSGDGMSDSIPTTIGGKQPARVANEEAFIPPSVVKRLGNGDTNRGAKKLYAMMDRIRKARTGTTEQGKEINPEKFMPGGKVSGYQTGGAITTNPSAGFTSSSLASWVGPYVADMLGKGQALSEAPYQAYTGPLTAGPSALEQQAFGAASTFQPSAAIGQAAQTAGGIAAAAQGMGYTPATFGNQFTAPGAYQTGTFGTDTFGTQQAQQYMNPYLQSALDPQMKEMQRQADIQRAADAARLTKAGAYGGSRQAIMEAEGRRNLLGKQAEVLGQGYATAYDKAQQAFAQDQARRLEAQRATEASRQFGAGQGLTSAQLAAQYGLSGQQAAEASRQFGSELGLRGLQTGLQAAQAQGNLGGLQTQYGLEGLRTLASLGGTQRGIEAEGIAADKAQFEEARLNPFKMLQFQQSLLSGLPLASQSLYQPGQSNLQQFASGATTVQQLLKALNIIK